MNQDRMPGEEQQSTQNTDQQTQTHTEQDAALQAEIHTERNATQQAEMQEQNTEPQAEPYTDPHINYLKEQHNPVHAPIPGLGLRSMKTALAAALTALLYAFLPNSNPTFACIGAIFGMGADMEESRRSGGNRFFGTIIGGIIGLLLFWVEHLIFPEGSYWLRLPLVFLGIIVLISLCVLFHWPGGVQPGGVVLCIILFNTPAHEFTYAIHRMIDTGVGVVVALLVNYFLPRSRMEHLLFLDR